jgi:hypothetical protein
MTDLRQGLDRSIAALPGEPVLAADHQHMFCESGIDEMMRQHCHSESRSAADLHGMGIRRPDTEMLGKHRGQHDMWRDRAVAAEDAVDFGSLQAGIGNRDLRRLAHEVERGRAFMLAV